MYVKYSVDSEPDSHKTWIDLILHLTKKWSWTWIGHVTLFVIADYGSVVYSPGSTATNGTKIATLYTFSVTNLRRDIKNEALRLLLIGRNDRWRVQVKSKRRSSSSEHNPQRLSHVTTDVEKCILIRIRNYVTHKYPTTLTSITSYYTAGSLSSYI